ncbi:hypothetical protein [Halorhabdus salina]|uniref:hypothetical protein n=1 Tax=Halorhabdus salina TaxID=2750670 RepID=UPI0015EF5608|nr:hypothetical protein [Halorhabdus salina]
MRWDTLPVGGLGAITTVIGVIVMARGVGLGTPEPILGVVTISGSILLWRGAVLTAAGAMYLSGASGGLTDRESQATVVMASLMIWVVAGSDLLATVLGAIPGGSGVWIAPPEAIVAALGPPYTPAVLLAVLALATLRYTGVTRP